jgi:hypothetical protein
LLVCFRLSNFFLLNGLLIFFRLRNIFLLVSRLIVFRALAKICKPSFTA